MNLAFFGDFGSILKKETSQSSSKKDSILLTIYSFTFFIHFPMVELMTD